ncbi:hypothetical protein LP316_08535 [Thalassotalea sp. LPB0316]|uniref:DUF6270 domain-containing protein n=1 Tax=Thalassotalea sp. LPB0316 TaxID=2769490 RepID=UPI001865DC82|nr:DUF6270 domain-containing protein [Thalassotalea sp. LPB0316]QOL24415.1 hypothetical protein LP316_08535 [Thalassotalea sp. LPB0316]
MVKSLAILGSCVSRDAYELVKGLARLDFYAARSSLASIYGGSSLNISEVDLEIPGKGKFEIRMLSYDINKYSKRLILESDTQYIMYDGIDERFDLLEVGNTLITRSNYLVNTDFGKSLESSKIIKRNSPDILSIWKSAADKFCHDVADKKVIIHKALWSTSYKNHDSNEVIEFDDEERRMAEQQNLILNDYYDYLESKLDNAFVIDVPKELVYSDYAHKWGRDFFHYGQEYYDYVAKELKKILGD